MQLDSYLELFTTFYGWAFANIIGEVVTGTGLIVLPFLIAILNTWKEAKERGEEDVGVMGIIGMVQTRLMVMLFVMSVCFFTSPITSLHHARLSYTPPPSMGEASPSAAQLPGTTNSTYDQALRDATDGTLSDSGNLAYVPAWWFTVMAVSSGVNSGVRNGIKNSGSDMRVLEDMARNATIENPVLLGNVQRFYSECFIPARSQYLQADPAIMSGSGAAILAEGNGDYGPTDADWMGSQFLRTEPGYYDTLRSRAPVAGFAIDYRRDTDYYDPSSGIDPEITGAYNPEFGRPTCKEWWENDLREKLISSSSMIRSFATAAGRSFTYTSPDKMKDEVARIASTTANPVFVDSEKIMGDHYDTGTTLGRAATGALSTFGVAKESFLASASMLPLMTALPMIQALVLMGIYTFLPLVVLLSGFDLKVLFLGAVAIMTVKLWASMWYIATWVDGHLINAMYPGALGNHFVQEAMMIAKGAVPPTYKRMILNTLLVFLFIGLPVIWSSMMGWIGIRLAEGTDRLLNQHGGAAANSGKNGLGVAGSLGGRKK
ncbi:conjugal transfer protein TraG [Diaphorobacter sp. HDW4A]|uniref:conjugal transfer protein TraG N-terminal domain-containing protein n=1 Tax=Diaphorobacter sp. HDW4A TaxID=2714924 RepID=UPI00140E0064|nr:conjugal transfer protein TraG N-terminal domain-containing protein [Diaphorobacter sp. HDW4A]QIL80336.1 conjugal transfer protein TraG [Diaphorobacter sp. HDW4A]